MTVSSRLVLAMVSLVVLTSCVVSAFAYYFVAEAPPRGALMAIISAALAGGALAAVFAIALAVGIANGLRKPMPRVTRNPRGRGYPAPVDGENTAQTLIQRGPHAFLPTDER